MTESLSYQTGARQTMSAWTKVIESFEMLPLPYRNFLETQIKDKQGFPLVLLAPSLAKPRGRTTEKLVIDAGDAMHILERKGGEVSAKSYPYRNICTVEVGSILLSSWLAVRGITSAGVADNSIIDFNTSSARHYEIFLKKLRPTPHKTAEGQSRIEQDKFDYLSTLNFKLMNYGRNSLLGWETVRQVLYQPEIQEPLWPLLGSLFQKLVTPPHLVILTDLELILVEDIGGGRQAHETHYGGVWQYIPLRSIRSANWSETGEDRLTLAVSLTTDGVIETIFAASNRPDLERLCAQIQAGPDDRDNS